MREIKFRAWDSVKNKYYSAEEMGIDQLTLMPDGRGFINVHSASTKLSHFCEHLIPEQFTGFHDSEGKEIYEGDIVKTDSTVSMEIVWYMFGWAFKFKNPDLIIDPIARDIGGESDIEGNKFKYIKIVGNIHEVAK